MCARARSRAHVHIVVVVVVEKRRAGKHARAQGVTQTNRNTTVDKKEETTRRETCTRQHGAYLAVLEVRRIPPDDAAKVLAVAAECLTKGTGRVRTGRRSL